MPSGPGVRVDTSMRAGERVPPDYDPLIAKIMTVGPDRDTAIDRMRRALDEVAVTGIQTTLPFDRALMRDPVFALGDVSTDWVEARWDGQGSRRDALVAAARLAAGVADAAVGGAGTPAEPPGATPSLRKDDGAAWRAAGRSAAVERWPR